MVTKIQVMLFQKVAKKAKKQPVPPRHEAEMTVSELKLWVWSRMEQPEGGGAEAAASAAPSSGSAASSRSFQSLSQARQRATPSAMLMSALGMVLLQLGQVVPRL